MPKIVGENLCNAVGVWVWRKFIEIRFNKLFVIYGKFKKSAVGAVAAWML